MAIRRARAIKSVRPTLLIKRDGNEMYIESTASPIRDGSGAVSGGVLVFHDVSESRELNRKLSYHASHDILTGLVNRREFELRLERSLRSAKARETAYALCHLDVDQFKIINDTCGHSAGDALLGQVGALLKTKIRWRDTLARLGGDEFGVLLESCSLDEALRMAEQLRETIRNYKFVWEERTFRLGCSIGVVPITGDSEDVAALLSAADSACQAAKEARAQPRLQLPGKRHRPDAPPPRDAVGRAHQQRARGIPLRAVPHDDPAAAEGRTRARTTSCCCA